MIMNESKQKIPVFYEYMNSLNSTLFFKSDKYNITLLDMRSTQNIRYYCHCDLIKINLDFHKSQTRLFTIRYGSDMET